MSAGITEESNGLAYDFGVAIAQGASSALAVMATKVIAITGSIYALIDAGKASDEVLRKNQLAMGGYANFLKSVDYFSNKVISGQSYFDVDNLMEGAKQLQHAGIDVKKNFDLINKAAQGIGSDFSSLSSIIRSGDFSALADAGLITDRMAKNMERTTVTQEQGTKRILALLKKAETKGLFNQNVATLSQTVERLRQIYKSFIGAILGDLKDPEGFWYVLKKAFSDFADFFAKRMDKIKKIGMLIGKILTFVVRTIAGFMRWTARMLKKLIGDNDKFFDNWQEKMLSLGLWLEILRVKIGAFFENWGPWILKLWAANSALNAVWMAGEQLSKIKKATFIEALTKIGKTAEATGFGKLAGYIKTTLIPAISTMGASIWTALAPVAVTVGIIVAIVAAIVLLVAYWDDIRKYAASTSDSTLALITAFVPLVGFIMIIAKYWTEIKTVAMNVWQLIVNITDIAISLGKILWDTWVGAVKTFFGFFKKIFTFIDNVLTKVFGSAWTKIKKVFFEPIKAAFNFLKELIMGVFDIDFGKGFQWVIDKISGLVDKSKNVADNLAKKAGREGFAGKSVSLDEVRRKEIRARLADGESVEDIKATMDNGNDSEGLNQAIQDEAMKLKKGEPIKKLDQKPKVAAQGIGNSNSQTNNYKIYVNKESDVDKVAKKIDESNKKYAAISNRRNGN